MKTYEIPRHPVYNTFAIVKTISGTYVCPGWHEVASGTTREQIKLVDNIQISPKKDSPIQTEDIIRDDKKEWKVKSSNGKSEYTVTNFPFWNCTCPAKQFRRGDCKHIKQIKNES